MNCIVSDYEQTVDGIKVKLTNGDTVLIDTYRFADFLNKKRLDVSDEMNDEENFVFYCQQLEKFIDIFV